MYLSKLFEAYMLCVITNLDKYMPFVLLFVWKNS